MRFLVPFLAISFLFIDMSDVRAEKMSWKDFYDLYSKTKAAYSVAVSNNPDPVYNGAYEVEEDGKVDIGGIRCHEVDPIIGYDQNDFRDALVGIAHKNYYLVKSLSRTKYPESAWMKLVEGEESHELRILYGALNSHNQIPDENLDLIDFSGSGLPEIVKELNIFRSNSKKYSRVIDVGGCGDGEHNVRLIYKADIRVQYISNGFYKICQSDNSVPESFCSWNDTAQGETLDISGRIAFQLTSSDGETRIVIKDVDRQGSNPMGELNEIRLE